MLLEQERRDVCLTARRLVDTGLAMGEGGSISVRHGDLAVVTPEDIPLDRVEPTDCPVLALDERVLDGRRAPGAETTLHMALHRHCESRAVVQAHAADTAAVAAALVELPPIHHRAARLGGAIPVTRYATYGTGELSDEVVKSLKGKRAALLANHGGVATGDDLAGAFDNARLLEWLCGLYIRARSLGEPRVLTEEELADVRHRDTYGWAGPDVW